MGTDVATVALRRSQDEATAEITQEGWGLSPGTQVLAPWGNTALFDGITAHLVSKKCCSLSTLISMFTLRSPLCPQLGPGSCHKPAQGWLFHGQWLLGMQVYLPRHSTQLRAQPDTALLGKRRSLCKTAKALLPGSPSSCLIKYCASHIKCFLSPA